MRFMKEKKKLSFPVIIAIAATRGMMGLGAGLLLSRKLERDDRERIGWALFGVGAATTVPLVAHVRHQ